MAGPRGGCHGPPGTKRPRSPRGPAWGPVAALVPGMLGSYCARRSGSGAHPGRFPLRADARLPMALLAVCMAGPPVCVGTVEGWKDAPAAPRVWQYISLPRGAERPAARTLRTGYCEARGRAEGMVDRRETELKEPFRW